MAVKCNFHILNCAGITEEQDNNLQHAEMITTWCCAFCKLKMSSSFSKSLSQLVMFSQMRQVLIFQFENLDNSYKIAVFTN